MNTKEILIDLTRKVGVSGLEDSVSNFAVELLKKYCENPRIDHMNNVIGCIPGKNRKGDKTKKIMLEAHMDQVGFLVSEIDKDGYISFVSIGGNDERILPCLRVKIIGKQIINGVIIAPMDELVVKKTVAVKELRIFTGYTEEELKSLISIGDVIYFDTEFLTLMNNSYSSSAMDNRSGMTAVISSLEYIKNAELDSDVYVVFTTQEEVGLRGAYTSTYNIKPDLAIVVDVTHGLTSDSVKDQGVFKLGSGAVIFRGPNADYHKTKKLVDLAVKNNIDYEIEAVGGASGTTGWAIQTIGSGVPVLIISIPLRYMHTNVEVLDCSDLEQVSKLIGVAVEYFGKDDAKDE